MHSGLGTPKEFKRRTIVYWFCQFLSTVHRRILKDRKTPQRFNQRITKRLDMDIYLFIYSSYSLATVRLWRRLHILITKLVLWLLPQVPTGIRPGAVVRFGGVVPVVILVYVPSRVFCSRSPACSEATSPGCPPFPPPFPSRF
jgi:hypothetical protein